MAVRADARGAVGSLGGRVAELGQTGARVVDGREGGQVGSDRLRDGRGLVAGGSGQRRQWEQPLDHVEVAVAEA